jgi:hypothetical protein
MAVVVLPTPPFWLTIAMTREAGLEAFSVAGFSVFWGWVDFPFSLAVSSERVLAGGLEGVVFGLLIGLRRG